MNSTIIQKYIISLFIRD